MVSAMSGWILFAFLVAEALAYLLAMRWIGRAWLAKRWSATRVAIAAGLLTTLLVGLPVMLSAMGEGIQWLVALVLLVGLAGYLIASNIPLWTYAERHGVRDELRRLIDKNPPR